MRHDTSCVRARLYVRCLFVCYLVVLVSFRARPFFVPRRGRPVPFPATAREDEDFLLALSPSAIELIDEALLLDAWDVSLDATETVSSSPDELSESLTDCLRLGCRVPLRGGLPGAARAATAEPIDKDPLLAELAETPSFRLAELPLCRLAELLLRAVEVPVPLRGLRRVRSAPPGPALRGW